MTIQSSINFAGVRSPHRVHVADEADRSGARCGRLEVGSQSE
jgi:hypothetical protein